MLTHNKFKYFIHMCLQIFLRTRIYRPIFYYQKIHINKKNNIASAHEFNQKFCIIDNETCLHFLALHFIKQSANKSKLGCQLVLVYYYYKLSDKLNIGLNFGFTWNLTLQFYQFQMNFLVKVEHYISTFLNFYFIFLQILFFLRKI